jgi:hypothetical protein
MPVDNVDQITETLRQMSELLRQAGHPGQAEYVLAVRIIAQWDSSAVTPALTSGAMWGGSGSVWDVGEFESDDAKRQYWRLLIDLVAEMHAARIHCEAADARSKALAAWLANKP